MAVIKLRNENGDRNIVYEFDDASNPLGEGGMGRVFRGYQIDLAHNIRRDVAIKMMFADLPDHVIERARREASIRIVNDNLLEMIDFVEVKEKNAYGQVLATRYHVVSEYLDGINLDELLEGRTVNHNGKPNAMAEKLYAEYCNNREKFVGLVFRNILSGIMALHYAGYVHRDVDPSNIMVTSDGKIKLIDFGIARALNALGQDKHLTSTGQFLGKTSYAAPELVNGDIAHQDYRTDIYALGIMLFQLIVGHLPFEGTMLEVSDKQLHSNLPLQQVRDRMVRRIIKKATQKKQENRYQTAAEFLVDIDKWILRNTTGQYGKKKTGSKYSSPKTHEEKKKNPVDDDSRRAILKISAIAASVAIIIAGGVVFFEKNTSSKSTSEKKIVVVDNSDQRDVVSQPEQKPEVAVTFDNAVTMMMDKATASDGFKMLNTLVDNGDYNATFLMSRLYFDPSESGRDSDTMFYDEQWNQMKKNCDLGGDNKAAHEYLMDAFSINSDDHVSLFALGSDFMANNGERGCERNLPYAKWCYQKADSTLGMVNSIEAKRYRTQIQSRLDRLKKEKSEKPYVENRPKNSGRQPILKEQDFSEPILENESTSLKVEIY